MEPLPIVRHLLQTRWPSLSRPLQQNKSPFIVRHSSTIQPIFHNRSSRQSGYRVYRDAMIYIVIILLVEHSRDPRYNISSFLIVRRTYPPLSAPLQTRQSRSRSPCHHSSSSDIHYRPAGRTCRVKRPCPEFAKGSRPTIFIKFRFIVRNPYK